MKKPWWIIYCCLLSSASFIHASDLKEESGLRHRFSKTYDVSSNEKDEAVTDQLLPTKEDDCSSIWGQLFNHATQK